MLLSVSLIIPIVQYNIRYTKAVPKIDRNLQFVLQSKEAVFPLSVF